MTTPNSESPEGRSSAAPAYHEDEISLIDLVISLWEHKWIIVGVTTLVTLIGLVYALSKERAYEYTTTIEIGTLLIDGDVRPIEPPQNVVAKLESSYVPEAIRIYQEELREQNGYDHRLTVSVRAPRDTNLVVLSSTAPEHLSEFYIPLQERVLGRLITDHSRTLDVERLRLENNVEEARRELARLEDRTELRAHLIPLERQLMEAKMTVERLEDELSLRTKLDPLQKELERAQIQLEELEDERVLRVERKRLENQIASARNQLEGLTDQEATARQELAHLSIQEELVQNRLEELGDYIAEIRKRRPEAVTQVGGGADSMALMLIDNEYQRYMDRHTELEERLLVGIPERRTSLANRLEEIQREQRLQQEEIDRLEAEYEKLLLQQERAVARHQPAVRELETKIVDIKDQHQRQLAEARPSIEQLENQIALEKASYTRTIAGQKEQVRELETRQSNLRETRAILPPRQSLQPVGTSRALIVALSVILGGMLGLLAVGLIILARSTRQRLQQQKST